MDMEKNDKINEKDSNSFNVQKPTGINIYIMSKDGKMNSLWLPLPAKERYYFDGELKNHVYFEARNNIWCAVAERDVQLTTADGHVHKMVDLYNKTLIFTSVKDKMYSFYIEMTNAVSNVFHNYIIPSETEISIGRNDSNDIVYLNYLVSKRHATIKNCDGVFWIYDTNSSNGVFVNGTKVLESRLYPGDSVYIMGLRLIIGLGFISINDGNDRIHIMTSQIKIASYEDLKNEKNVLKMEDQGEKYFNRSPRYKRQIIPGKIHVEAPPLSINSNQIPLLLRMGGSAVMSGSAALSGNYTMLITSLLFPVLTNKYTEKQKKEYEERRVQKYTEYLVKKKEEINVEKKKEESILNENYPNVNTVLQYATDQKYLWVKRTVDDDFLDIRVGEGKYPIFTEIDFPEDEFEMDEDFLREKMMQIVNNTVMLEKVPIVLSLVEYPVSSIVGEKKLKYDFFRNVLSQIVMLHSYDEVKTIFLMDTDEVELFDYIKYIPHSWNDQRTERYIATNIREAYHIGKLLHKELEETFEKKEDLTKILKERPYYVIFAMNGKLFETIEIFKDIMQAESNCGVSIITMFDDLPKDCSVVYDLKNTQQSELIYLQEIERENVKFAMDSVNETLLKENMFQMSSIYLKTATQQYTLPKNCSFLEMFHAGKIEHLNITERWKKSDSVKSLAVPIGVATDGTPFMLDLHEKFQGPHGLVAGTTGSGKSEFLITYILSMAINYHPDDVAFLLIDYKGGGLADAFENKEKGIYLPHLVGTITNLDGSAIQRSLISLYSEVKRRQFVFRQTKMKSDEGTMDIYSYQKLFHQHKVHEPLPHLFIIADEFAELKKQEPEFMEQLISIARIGRSLGIHLILATQKPGGVVNDQIRSNSKFRICLKVQDRSDSMDIIGKPFGADIKETGRFYLQVGQNELFALGQSAWTGAEYLPQDEVISNQDNSVQFIDTIGQVIHSKKYAGQKSDSGMTQLVALVKTMSDLIDDQEIQKRCLWKPALEKKIDAKEFIKSFVPAENNHVEMKLLCGIVDDPENQDIFPYEYNLNDGRNLLICGEALSGKTSLLQYMIWHMTSLYSPDQLNLYILDFSSQMLGVFEKLPHCGVVIKEEDEKKIRPFFQFINETVNERKKLFKKLEADSFIMAREKMDIPLIIVVIDNLAGLMSSKNGQDQAYELPNYMKMWSRYGVKFIVTAGHMNEVLTKTRQELRDRISLQQNDKYAYGDVLNTRCNYAPVATSGRGMVVVGERALEIQIPLYAAFQNSNDRISELKADVQTLADKYKDHSGVRNMFEDKKNEKYEDFCDNFSDNRLALGYEIDSKKKIALPFKQFSFLSVYFGNHNGVLEIWKNFTFSAKRENAKIIFIKRKERTLFTEKMCEEHCVYEVSQNDMDAFRNELLKLLQERKEWDIKYKDREEMEKDLLYSDFMLKHTQPIYYLIEDYDDFVCGMDELTESTLELILGLEPNTTLAYNIHFIAGFYPDKFQNLLGRGVFQKYIASNLMLLFGDKNEKQSLCNIPREFSQITKNMAWNRYVMNYKEEFHLLEMPCGELPNKKKDPDELSIFNI